MVFLREMTCLRWAAEVLERSAMSPLLSPGQQTILAAIEHVESGVRDGTVVLEGNGEAMRRSELVTRVCDYLHVNGSETRVAVYDVLRMRDEGSIPKKTT